jgi:hypothetical protein
MASLMAESWFIETRLHVPLDLAELRGRMIERAAGRALPRRPERRYGLIDGVSAPLGQSLRPDGL